MVASNRRGARTLPAASTCSGFGRAPHRAPVGALRPAAAVSHPEEGVISKAEGAAGAFALRLAARRSAGAVEEPVAVATARRRHSRTRDERRFFRFARLRRPAGSNEQLWFGS